MPRHVPTEWFESVRAAATPSIAEIAASNGRGSGFHYTQLGPLVEHDPASACVLLRAKLSAANGNVSEVARQEDVTYKTVARWISRLVEKGFDPRQQPVPLATA